MSSGGSEHLFWPGQSQSLCGLAGRTLRPEGMAAQRDHVPIVIHFLRVCPTCLEIAEIGPLDKSGNRCVPSVSGYVVSERERPRVWR